MVTGTSYCTWYGVSCSANETENIYDPNNGMTGNLVVKLALSNNGLGTVHYENGGTGADTPSVGTIPEGLGQLRGLQELWLDHNGLYGSIPNSIGEAWKMTILHIESNSLTGAPSYALESFVDMIGAIPQGIGQMRFLQQFFFDHNEISGTLRGGNADHCSSRYS